MGKAGSVIRMTPLSSTVREAARAGTTRKTIAKLLVKSNPKALLATSGLIKAKNRVVAFPKRKLKKGRYVFAIRMQTTMNPSRVTVVVSSAFRVSAPR